jgi:ABC-type transporter Mla subunit MlaD
MTTRGQTLKLVIFLAVSAVVTVLLLTAFGGLDLFRRTSRYFVEVPGGVAGLEHGSAVTLLGVRIGSVSNFELYPDARRVVRVELEVDPDVPIPKGARASLKFQGLTGLKTVDIDAGKSERGFLAPGASIPYEPSALDRISDDAEELAARSVRVLEKVETLAERLDDVARAIDPERVRRIVANVDDGAAEARRAAAGARHTSQELAALVGEARAELRATAKSTRELVGATAATVDQAGQTLAAVERVSRDVGGLVRSSNAELRGIAYDLRDASRSLKQFSTEIRLQPSRLLFSSPPPERELP